MKGFRDFLNQGNVLQLAVAFVIGREHQRRQDVAPSVPLADLCVDVYSHRLLPGQVTPRRASAFSRITFRTTSGAAPCKHAT